MILLASSSSDLKLEAARMRISKYAAMVYRSGKGGVPTPSWGGVSPKVRQFKCLSPPQEEENGARERQMDWAVSVDTAAVSQFNFFSH